MKIYPSSLPSSFKTFLLAAALAAAFAFLTGCRSPAPASVAPEAAGAYTLKAVDGKNVPCTIGHEGSALKIESGRFTLDADGKCASLIKLVAPSGKSVDKNVHGSFTQNGSALAFAWQGAGKTKGTIEGDALSMNNEGIVFSYRREVPAAAP